MNLKDTKIAIIGLGYVGLPLAVEFAKKFPTGILRIIRITKINYKNYIFGLRKKTVKKMMKCSVKKEIKPHGTRIIGKPSNGALISFSGMESFLGLFSTALIFCYFCIKTKVRESRYRQEIIKA